MKPRKVIATLELRTNLPLTELRKKDWVHGGKWFGDEVFEVHQVTLEVVQADPAA